MHPFGCFSPDVCPGVGLQGHMVALFLVFKGISILFSTVAVPILIEIFVKMIVVFCAVVKNSPEISRVP